MCHHELTERRRAVEAELDGVEEPESEPEAETETDADPDDAAERPAVAPGDD